MAENPDYSANVLGFPGGPRAPLPPGGGGENFGGMETRIAKLESDVGHITSDVMNMRADLRDIQKYSADARERLAKVETKIDHLPSKGFVVSVVMVGLALVTAVTLFQTQIQHLIGVTGK